MCVLCVIRLCEVVLFYQVDLQNTRQLSMSQGNTLPSGHVYEHNLELALESKCLMCQHCSKNHGSNRCVNLFCGYCCRRQSTHCPRHHLRRPQHVSKTVVNYSTSLQEKPPWLVYPCFGRHALGWRMGDPNTYWSTFWDKYCVLTRQQRKWYRQDFPEPRGWNGTYHVFNGCEDRGDSRMIEEDEDDEEV